MAVDEKYDLNNLEAKNQQLFFYHLTLAYAAPWPSCTEFN